MAFDPEREIETIEAMKEQVRSQFDRSSRNNSNSSDRDQRVAAAASAQAYAELVKAQAALVALRKPSRGLKPYQPTEI